MAKLDASKANGFADVPAVGKKSGNKLTLSFKVNRIPAAACKKSDLWRKSTLRIKQQAKPITSMAIVKVPNFMQSGTI